MKQIKIFQGDFSNNTQQAVNEWLADPRNPEPLEIVYQYSEHYTGVMIVYELPDRPLRGVSHD